MEDDTPVLRADAADDGSRFGDDAPDVKVLSAEESNVHPLLQAGEAFIPADKAARYSAVIEEVCPVCGLAFCGHNLPYVKRESQ
jgi:hypothetical protein